MARQQVNTGWGEIVIRLLICSIRGLLTRCFWVLCLLFFLAILWAATRGPPFNERPTTLCVAVLSAPNTASAERREAVRETWMSLLDDGVRNFFFVGSEGLTPEVYGDLAAERGIYGDIVLLPVIDSYQNLTIKLLHAIKYMVKETDCKFILKADDDSFARIDLIVSELEVVKVEQWLYWGYFTGKAPVFKKGVWAEHNWFLCDRYLPYARGGGYIFSHKVAKLINDYMPVLQHYTSEDVSFGAWTAGLRLHRVHDPRFDTEYQSRGCLNSYLVTHKQSVGQMREKFNNIRTTGRLCTEEHENRRAYNYNWSVPPSHCCENI